MDTAVYNADAARALLVRRFEADGFTYYPPIHRLLRKREDGRTADVVVVDLWPDYVAIHHERSSSATDTASDALFGYEQPEEVLRYMATISVAPKRRHLMVA